MENTGNLRVCWKCLMGIESHEGKQHTTKIYIDVEDEPEKSICEWCEEDGFEELYEFV